MRDGFAAIAAKGATMEELAGVKGELKEVRSELRNLTDRLDSLMYALMAGGFILGLASLALGALLVTQA